CTSPLRGQRVEAGIAPDVEHGAAGKRWREEMPELTRLDRRIVAEEVVRCGPYAGQLEIVKPGAELRNSPRDVLPRKGRRLDRSAHRPASSDSMCTPGSGRRSGRLRGSGTAMGCAGACSASSAEAARKPLSVPTST